MAVKSAGEDVSCKSFGGWIIKAAKVKVRYAIFEGSGRAGKRGEGSENSPTLPDTEHRDAKSAHKPGVGRPENQIPEPAPPAPSHLVFRSESLYGFTKYYHFDDENDRYHEEEIA